MKKAHQKALTFYSFLITWFIGILGFSSCEDNTNNLRAEYGTPTATYKIRGTVTSEQTDAAIPNINVRIMQTEVKTDANGDYELVFVGLLGEENIPVYFEDVDGTQNGSYEDKEKTVNFKDANFSGGDGWYWGETTTDLDAALDEEEL